MTSSRTHFKDKDLDSEAFNEYNIPINHIPAAISRTDVNIKAVTLQLLM